MNISSNINQGLVSSSMWEAGISKGREMESTELSATTDQVNLSASAQNPTLLEDHEVEGVLEDTMGMIGDDPYAALHVHGGLDAARVAALLA